MTPRPGFNERGASPSSPTHQNAPTRQLQLAMTELKKRGEDGTPPLGEVLDGSRRLATRDVIAETLRRLHADEADLRRREVDARERQRDRSRSLVRLAQLETADQSKLATHTAHVRLQREICTILETLRNLEDCYQQRKKELASIPNKTERHRQVQLAKDRRDEALAPLRERLRQLDPEASPVVVVEERVGRGASLLPTLRHDGGKISSTMYRQTMDQICMLQKTRKTMMDPYAANLKMAKLWHHINDHERALENYEKALRSLNENQTRLIPAEDLARVLERARRRKRDALKYLFNRSLASQQRDQAAKQMEQYLELSTALERQSSIEYLETILRSQEYVEDPSLSSPDEVTINILSTHSLGPLTDLRFRLLQELLAASPTNPSLLETVASFHLRKHEFCAAKDVSDRFIKLPDVKQIQLYSSLGEYKPSSL